MNTSNNPNLASNDAFKSIYTHSSAVPSQLQRFFLPSIASTTVSQSNSTPLQNPALVSQFPKHDLNTHNTITSLHLPTDLQARLEQVQKSVVKPTPIQPLQLQPVSNSNSMVYDFKLKKKSAKRIMVNDNESIDFETTRNTWHVFWPCHDDISCVNRFY